jgi:hypothetical protein
MPTSEPILSEEREMTYQLKRWEFNALLLQSILVSAVAMAAVMRAAHFPAHSASIAQFFLIALAFAMPSVFLHPVLTAQLRNLYGRQLSAARAAMWTVIGSLVGASLACLLT